MKPIALASTLVLSASLATGCVPTYDYEGDYAMTYAAVTAAPGGQPSATAGTTRVDVAPGLGDDFLVDLGPTFCRLTGKHTMPTGLDEVPHIDIAPQPCWYTIGETSYPLSLGGTATFDEAGERLTIVVTGSMFDPNGKPRASTTIQFTETW